MTDIYRDIRYKGADGLTLYARDYENPGASLTVLCLHGLTRNSADFSDICQVLQSRYRIIVPDQRGRGLSDSDPTIANYHPGTYVNDMFRLLELLSLSRVAVIGTSMGGLMAMMMAAMQPHSIVGMVINDIGPVVNPKGLARIKGYVGKRSSVETWEDAAAYAKAINGSAFPDYNDEDWLDFAQKIYRRDDAGLPVPAYDPNIAIPIVDTEENAVPPDLWPAFDACVTLPMLVIRGEISDILSRDCVEEMHRRKVDLKVVEIPRRGHAPMLNESEAVEAIASFLDEVGRG